MKQMTFLDLCSGIGGFKLGYETAGHKCIGSQQHLWKMQLLQQLFKRLRCCFRSPETDSTFSFGKYHYLLDYTGIQSDIWYYQKERRPAEWKLLQMLKTGKN